MAVLDYVHKGTVLGLMSFTAAWAAFIPARLYEIRIKSKELAAYATEKGLDLEVAAKELGYGEDAPHWLEKSRTGGEAK
eukprot:CAMPEP_0173380982 /NCGR_PEP_ID=MMETSP1356-20130122/3512_1 /TAXON_ID=77927 ORGANISM="Hemiselmis virescens, Strain PCC157" /NCGR_SAMPLE_ID=MMETSP1356 /ASSEMBLY_ACC=CAM_ASM_000847 /LENGTH=78 /DNA_ID=CAMNT_0014334709 /DNA_START=36 /DNA_END=272 /DNA_ORIENTATION=-